MALVSHTDTYNTLYVHINWPYLWNSIVMCICAPKIYSYMVVLYIFLCSCNLCLSFTSHQWIDVLSFDQIIFCFIFLCWLVSVEMLILQQNGTNLNILFIIRLVSFVNLVEKREYLSFQKKILKRHPNYVRECCYSYWYKWTVWPR